MEEIDVRTAKTEAEWPVDQLNVAKSNLKRITELFDLSPKKKQVRTIDKVSDIYGRPKVSQWLLDVAMRSALNLGNWTTSIGFGLYRGYLAFAASRDRFRAVSRLRPPIYVPESKARKDLEYLLTTEQVRRRS